MDSRISARALSAALGGWRTREPAYEALADGIRLLCLDNRIAPRTALPAERELVGCAERQSQHRRRGVPESRESGAHREHPRLGQRDAALAPPGPGQAPRRARGRSICSRPVHPHGRDWPASCPKWPCRPSAIVSRIGYDVARSDRTARGDRRSVLASAASRRRRTRSSSPRARRARSICLRPCCSGRGDRVLIETPDLSARRRCAPPRRTRGSSACR